MKKDQTNKATGVSRWGLLVVIIVALALGLVAWEFKVTRERAQISPGTEKGDIRALEDQQVWDNFEEQEKIIEDDHMQPHDVNALPRPPGAAPNVE